MQRKITAGFLVLILLLGFSGVVSYLELRNLSRDTATILDANLRNAELSRRMLDAVERQNNALIREMTLQPEDLDSLFFEGIREFDAALAEAAGDGEPDAVLDPVIAGRDRYRNLTERFYGGYQESGLELFLEAYEMSYIGLIAAIREYVSDSQYALEARAIELESNAYRAIVPGIITLVVAVAIILVFMFMTGLYYTRPIVNMQRSLAGYLKHNIPFNVTAGGSDEVARLKEDIETLITANKRNE